MYICVWISFVISRNGKALRKLDSIHLYHPLSMSVLVSSAIKWFGVAVKRPTMIKGGIT